MVNKYRTLISIILVCVMFLCFFAILGIFSAYSEVPTETISSSSSSSDPKDRLCTICGKNKYQFKDANGVRRCRECSMDIYKQESEATQSRINEEPKYDFDFPSENSSSAYSSSSTYYSNDLPALQVKDVTLTSSGGCWWAEGTVKNNSNKTYYFVKVKALFSAEKGGDVLDTGMGYACGDEGLAPGESSKFTVLVDYDSRINWVQVNVYDWW